MSIKSRLRGWLSEKAASVHPIIAMQSLGHAVWMPREYGKFAEEAFKKNVIAYRCITELATSAAQAPWLLQRVDGSGNKVDLSEHALLDLLRRPNPDQGGSAFIEAVTGYYNISGNTYIEGLAPTGKVPLELNTLRPDRMKIIPSLTGVAAYEYEVGGRTKRWNADDGEVLHIKTFNPTNDWYGMSPIEAAAYSVDVHNATLEWNKALLDNRAQPSGAMVYAPKEGPATMTDEQYLRLKQEVDDQYTGARNAGKPMLLEGGLTWQQIGLSPQDMDYINSKNVTSRDIALAFGVPPMLLGIPGDNTYSNMQEARMALWEQNVLPWLYKLRDELNNWLVPKFDESLRLSIDEDSISALSPRRERVWDKVQGADFLTINEKREAVGYAPVKGGDQVLAPATLLPIGFVDDSAAKDTEALEAELKSIGCSEEFITRVMSLDYDGR